MSATRHYGTSALSIYSSDQDNRQLTRIERDGRKMVERVCPSNGLQFVLEVLTIF